MCGYLRCSDCNHNFVSEKGEICESCSPNTCEECSKPSKKYFISPSNTKIPYMPKRVCRECLTNKKLEFNPTGRYPTETCRECLEEKVLNDENYCAECYEEISNRVNINTLKHTCADCKAWYTPASSDQYLCLECIPNCEGCGKHFNPENRISTLCPSCTFNARRGYGRCGRCNENNNQLNSNGHCKDCEAKEYIKNSDSQLKSYCTRCHDNQVTSPNRICARCVGDRNICPECKKINIHGYEYICSDCKEARKI